VGLGAQGIGTGEAELAGGHEHHHAAGQSVGPHHLA
jgi:hypothetical protein